MVESQERHGWGKKIVNELSKDLMRDFPGQKGMSPSNLWRMRQFYLTYRDSPNLAQLVRDLPWGHNTVLLSGKFDEESRMFYLRKSLQHGWTRAVLEYHIDAKLYERTLPEQRSNNFAETLPAKLVEQANEAIKSSYNLEFLGVEEEIPEAELEARLITRIKGFLLELGYGFTFMGQQFRMVVGDTDYWVDLLFYHRGLQCLVAIDLKVTKFKPEYAGKMHFYLNVLNDKVRLPHENPSIGIILCKEKDNFAVEYSLNGVTNPIGVAAYQLFQELPAEVREQLPSPDQLRKQLLIEEE
ncbi:MAG: PDDEXK nuclease domain-containing protein [Bacteroidota bacterium]